MNSVVRSEQSVDISAIDAVHRGSFPTDAEAKLVNLLRDAGNLTLSLVAESEGSVIGHVAFSPVTVAGEKMGLGLAPVAVLEDFRRQGVAARLIEAGISAAKGLRFGWIVVLGDPAYYARFGFRPAPEYGLSDEYGGGDAFQVLEIVPGMLPVGAGLVWYAPEFAIVA